MKATGITYIDIEEGITLNNPELTISNVNYDWVANVVRVSIYFKEKGGSVYTHEKGLTFTIEPGKEYTTTDITKLVSEHEALKAFE